MLCKVVYCTDGFELFNYILLKTSMMFNIFENQDSLFKIIDFIHLAQALVALYGYDQQRLIWYVCRLWDMVFS